MVQKQINQLALEPQRAEEDGAYQMALRYLTGRPRTVAAMRARLKQTFADATVEVVVVRLKQEGLLDDLAFARQWRGSRQETRPRSAALLRWEMVQRGIPRDLANEAVAGLDDEQAAYEVAVHYLRRLAELDGVAVRRLSQHLQRRGFAAGVVRRILERLRNEGNRAGQQSRSFSSLLEGKGSREKGR